MGVTERAKEVGLWRRVEVLGDVGILSLPFRFQMESAKEFAQEVMMRMNLKSVWGRFRGVRSEYRLSEYVHLAGEERSEVTYRENGCTFKLDFTKVFFSQTLSFEHLRVGKEVRSGEVVVNMFAGFGPFSVIAAKIGRPKVVYSIDLNPYAYYYMHVNRSLNDTPEVVPIFGDAFERRRELRIADRIIAPLPERWRDVWKVVHKHARSGTQVHLYVQVEVKKRENPLAKAEELVPEGERYRVVRSLKPTLYHVAVDLEVTRRTYP